MKPDGLKRIYLFETCNREESAELLAHSAARQFRQGESLFQVGEPAKSLFAVEHGSVKLWRPGRKPSDEASVVGAGSTLGELGFLDRGKRQAEATALEPTVALEIPYEALEELLRTSTGFAERFYRALAGYLWHRVRQLPEDISSLASLKLRLQ